MATNIQILKTGSTTSAGFTEIYSPGAGKSALVTSVILSNNSVTSSIAVALGALTGGTTYSIYRNSSLVNTVGSNLATMADLVSLDGAEALHGKVSGGTVDWVVYGIERN